MSEITNHQPTNQPFKSPSIHPPPQTRALQQVEAAGGASSRARGRGGHGNGWPATAGAHGKLKALLFMMQRALCHPKQLALPQLDTIKRSLQVQQRLGMLDAVAGGGGGAGADGGIPLVRIDDLLARLGGRNAHGGLVRDVGRTWAMAGDAMERCVRGCFGLVVWVWIWVRVFVVDGRVGSRGAQH